MLAILTLLHAPIAAFGQAQAEPAGDPLIMASTGEPMDRRTIEYARRLIDKAQRLVDRHLRRGEIVEAIGALRALGALHDELGETVEAEAALRRAVEIARTELALPNHELASALARLSGTLAGQGRVNEAVAVRRESVLLVEQLYGRSSREWAVAATALATELAQVGSVTEALALASEALTWLDTSSSVDPEWSAEILFSVGHTFAAVGKLEEARRVFNRLADAAGALDQAYNALMSLGSVELRAGDLDGARSTFETALAMARSIWGDSSTHVADVLEMLTTIAMLQADHATAARLARDVVRIRVALLGESAQSTVAARTSLASELLALDDPEGALQTLAPAFEAAVAGDDDGRVVSMLWTRAGANRRIGNTREVLADTELILQHVRVRGPRDDRDDLALTLDAVANLREEVGEFASAVAAREEAVEAWRESRGPDSPEVGVALARLGHARDLAGDIDGAIRDLQVARLHQERVLGPMSEPIADTCAALADALVHAERIDEGLSVRYRAVEILAATRGPAADKTVQTAAELVLTPMRVGRIEDAVAAARTLEQMTQRSDASPAVRATALTLLGRTLATAGQLKEASAALDGAIVAAGEQPSIELFFAHLESAGVYRAAGVSDPTMAHLPAAAAALPSLTPRSDQHVMILRRLLDAFAENDYVTVVFLEDTLLTMARASGDPEMVASHEDALVSTLYTHGVRIGSGDPPQPARALEVLERARTLDEETGRLHAYEISSAVAVILHVSGDPARAADEYRVLIAAIAADQGPEAAGLFDPLQSLVVCLSEVGDVAGAIDIARRAAYIGEKGFGRNSTEHLDALHWLALMLEMGDRNLEAATTLRAALDVSESVRVADTEYRVNLLRQLGRTSTSFDNLSARHAYEEALALVLADRERFGVGTELELRDEVAHELAMVGEHEASIDAAVKALEVATEAYGAAEPRTIQRVGGLVDHLIAQQRSSEALALLEQYFEYMPVTGPSDLRAALFVSLSAALGETGLGRIPEALEAIDSAAESAISDAMRADIALARARWECWIGSWDEALKDLAQARDIADDLPGFRHEGWQIRTLPLTIQVYLGAGDLASAKDALDQLRVRFDDLLAEDGNHNYAVQAGALTLLRLDAGYRERAGDRAGALLTWTGAVENCRRILPADSRACIPDALGLARSLAAMGRPTEALDVVAETIEAAAASPSMGGEDPLLSVLRADRAFYTWGAGDPDSARNLLRAAASARSEILKDLMVSASDDDRLRAADYFRPTGDLFLSMFDRPADATEAYAIVLSTKGIAAASTLALQGMWRDGRDANAADVATRLDAANDALVTARLTGSDSERSLKVEADRLRRQLTRIGVGRSPVMLSTPTLDEVCRALPGEAVFVDFVRYRRRHPELAIDGEASYAAFVVEPKSCVVSRIDLGSANAIDEAANSFGIALAAGRNGASSVETHGRRVRSLVWDPIEAAVDHSGRVVLATDSALSFVPFGALPANSGRFLVEDQRIDLIESAYDLFRPRAHGLANDALVVGEIAYGPPIDLEPKQRVCDPAGSFRGLPATGAEADDVASSLADAGFQRVSVLRGTQADELSVRAHLEASSVVHLATHGFSSACGGAGRAYAGLALAGANYGGGRPASDDGLLMAEEVAELNLAHLRVAVLSACSTGIGKVEDGQGVIGLRRAFATAGADAVVVSLWSIEDDPTRSLMALFYDELWTAGSPAEALRRAQLAMLKLNLATWQEPRAYTWAGFIAVGGIR